MVALLSLLPPCRVVPWCSGSLAEDMRAYVRLAASMDIIVTWCTFHPLVAKNCNCCTMTIVPSLRAHACT